MVFAKFLKVVAIGAVTAVNASGAVAQDFPSQPITLIVPFSAGGPTDAAGRLVGNAIESRISQPVVVQNVEGAGSTIGAARVATASPDGYTLLMATSTAMVVAPHTYSNLSFDGYRSFSPVGLVTQAPFVLLVRPDSGFASLNALIEHGQANPGALNFATPGVGTVQHLSLEMLVNRASIDAMHIPFRGTSGARTAFLGNQVDFMIETPNAALPLLESGDAVALAALSDVRLTDLPDVPTAQEEGLDVVARSWFAVMAPAGTPDDRLDVLRGLLASALEDEALIQSMTGAGFVPTPISIAEFGSMLEAEYNNFEAAVAAAGIERQ